MFNSRIALGVIRALDAAGDRAGALQQARIHALRLQGELGVEPDPEVSALVERLRTPGAGPALARGSEPVERAVQDHGAPLEFEPAPPARAEESGSRPARRWSRPAALAGMSGLALLAIIAVLLSNQRPQKLPGEDPVSAQPSAKHALPIVVMMDSPHPSRVYDEETRLASGTNADILNDILRDLPIQRVKETAGPIWHRDEEIRQLDPDLIVMHFSAFCEEVCEASRIRLRAFIEYLAGTETQFLLYSRMPSDTLAIRFKEMMGDLPQRYPGLPARVHLFETVEHGTPHWKDPATAAALKLRVRELLGLR